MMPPTSIDGTDITGATIDGTDVQEITVDGQTVFTSGPPSQGLLHHWDWSAPNSTTSFVEDLAGSADASGTFNGFGSINGKQAGFFNGGIFESFGISNFSSNRLIAGVFQFNPNADSGQQIWDTNGGGTVGFFEFNSTIFFNQGGSSLNGGTISSSPHISVIQIDSTDIMRIDGVQRDTGNSGTNNMGTIRFGLNRFNGNELKGNIGEILMYELSSSPPVSDIENYLSGSWGISI